MAIKAELNIHVFHSCTFAGTFVRMYNGRQSMVEIDFLA